MKQLLLLGLLFSTAQSYATTQVASCVNADGETITITNENDGSIWVNEQGIQSRIGDENDIVENSDSRLSVVSSENVSSIPTSGDESFFAGVLTNTLKIDFNTGVVSRKRAGV